MLYKTMTRHQLFPVLFCVLTVAFCNTQREESKNRALSPPVVSFLEMLKNLKSASQGLSATWMEERFPYVAPEEVQEHINAPESPLSHHQREKRHIPMGIAMRGCHLGTCQLQNLASTLYRLGNNNGKNDSNRNTKDPLGYGRRRRSLARKEQNSLARRTAVVQRQLAT